MPFLGKFGPKNQNYLFKTKFGVSDMPNLMVMLNFFVFNQKHPFCADFIQKVKIVSLKLIFKT